MKPFPGHFKRTVPEPDDGRGMISPAATKDAFRQSAIRFMACIAALSVAGLALVFTHPAWWPLSVVTAGSVPLLYHLAGLGRFRSTGSVTALGVMERLGLAGYAVWHDVALGERVASHVVIGPTGVFAISRVTWSGRFQLGEDGWPRHSRQDAGPLMWEASKDVSAVKARLRAVGLRRVPVRGIVAATRAAVPACPIDVGQAVLIRLADVPAYVCSGPPSLAPEQMVRAIAAFEGEEPSERSHPGRS
jgi:hypothetical protein